MDASTRSLIEALHQTCWKCVLAVTGGGSGAIADLLAVPGGSRTILEAVVPYHEHALGDFLGHRPDSFCSASTAHAMAGRALQRARWLAPGELVAGIGCTASLVSDRPKRGEHRFYLAVHTDERTLACSVTLAKGARDRAAEEAFLDTIMLNALAEAFGIAARLEPALAPGEKVEFERRPRDDLVAALVHGQISTVEVDSEGRLWKDSPTPALLLPGAFNPVHEGHWSLAATATRLTGLPTAFELSVANVDKPSLTVAEVRRRLHPFTWKASVWLTRAPTFVEKARLFPGTLFVVGADTAQRIVEERYYQNSVSQMREALGQLRAQGCRFLVAGRADASGRFLGLEELGIGPEFGDLFTGIPEAEFHVDVSSTQLRQSGEARRDGASAT